VKGLFGGGLVGYPLGSSSRSTKEIDMAIGPVQLLVLGFDHPDFQGDIQAELDRLKENDAVRVISGAAVYKDADGKVTTLERSDLSEEEAAEFGAVVGALIGFGAGGFEGAEAGGAAGAAAAADGIQLANEEELLNVAEEIPNDSAAALLLLEHRWAIPLRDAIRGANGYPVADGWVRPEDLVAVGLIAAEEAAAQTT
jgi:uncharacterized membrane protein